MLENPAPNFAELEQVLKGQQIPRRVHLVELSIDDEVLQAITEGYLGEPWIAWEHDWINAPPPEPYLIQLITLYYKLGYDLVPKIMPTFHHLPTWRRQWAEDTAGLSKERRGWVDQGRGLISSWQDFEKFPWDRIKPECSACEMVARNLPEGMKMAVSTKLFEHVLENLLGYETFFYKLYDEPELVSGVFNLWGQKVYNYYKSVIGMDEVGVIFHLDDLGFRTSTMVSPTILRQFVFPWLRRYAALAHDHRKMFWLHSCGNLFQGDVIEDLLQDVQIDAFHSFQDIIMPVAEFKARYGDRVATLGGVDMDKLVRMDETSLREYIRGILKQCVPGGRFALGSGNGIANYIPLHNYLIMLDESRRYLCD